MDEHREVYGRLGPVVTRRVFLLPLFAGLAAGGAPPAPRRLRQRSLYLSGEPGEEVPDILVWARTVTTLRFEAPVDARRTKLEGAEARFEPLLIGDRSISLYPLHELAPEDRFRLTVGLAGGELLPFTLRSDRERVDGQVDVFPDPASCEALRQHWREIQEERQRQHADLQRRVKEELSVEHALATLLVMGAERLTRLQEGSRKWSIRETGLTGTVVAMQGMGKVAVLLTVTNHDPRFSWSVSEIRLTHSVTQKPKGFSLRVQRASLPPGDTGRIALVTDASPKDAAQPYLLEIFREDGVRHIAVDKLML
ncbi:DUF2381 family protein [Hyalangium gracile]|uniref:DUF2381 family protein n=1 Tax=Hyalangium gracile TaxID=394092 RepID=UPI001CCE3588|nr:DUF2381 family protein [Hyalangium gracile]